MGGTNRGKTDFILHLKH